MITKEKLTEYGVSDDKHEAILKEYGEYTTGIDTKHAKDKTDAQRSMMDGMDKVGFDAFGIEKEQNEQTSAYLMRVAGLSKQKAFDELTTSSKAKIDELNKKISDGLTDQKLKDEIEAIRETLDNERKLWETEKGDITKAHESYKTKQVLLNAVPTFKSDVDKKYAKFLTDNAVKDIEENYKIQTNDDHILLVGKESVKFANIKLDDYYKESLKDVIDSQHTQGGAGSGGAGSGGSNEIGTIDSDSQHVIMGKIKDYLIKDNVDLNTTEGQKRYDELHKKYILKR